MPDATAEEVRHVELFGTAFRAMAWWRAEPGSESHSLMGRFDTLREFELAGWAGRV